MSYLSKVQYVVTAVKYLDSFAVWCAFRLIFGDLGLEIRGIWQIISSIENKTKISTAI